MVSGNELPGRLSGLDSIADYRLPFFIGLYAVVDWRERTPASQVPSTIAEGEKIDAGF
jgi:hypothetical protein